MSDTLAAIQTHVRNGEIRISEHGYDEMIEDDLHAREVLAGIGSAIMVEEYPTYPKGPCVLVLQQDRTGLPIHVVWGIPKGRMSPAVLVTAYRPDPARWAADFTRRR